MPTRNHTRRGTASLLLLWGACCLGPAAGGCGDDSGSGTPSDDGGPTDTGGRTDLGRADSGAPECTGDGDCASTEVCVDGACVDRPAECTTDDDCPSGRICTPAGVCAPAPVDCTTDAECDPDGLTGGLYLCMAGTCGPAPLDGCPAAELVARVCSVAARDSFCVMGLFVSCGSEPSCEACAGACDPASGCASMPDMGPPPADTGPPPVDMGPPPADMGPPPADMGPPPADMGPPPADTGPPPADTGPPDMGPPDMGPMLCGNGVVDPGEDCDGPAPASCDGPGCDGECHAIALVAGCGNGCAEPGEACGEPGLAMCPGGSACMGCACVVTCNDGVADPGEQCNEPGLACGPGTSCDNASCQCVPTCGNGTLDPGELCDPPNAPSCASTTYCTATCQQAARPSMCGNGCIDPGEECGEPGAPACAGGARCGSNCRCIPNCGNGILDLGETCDPPEPVPAGPGCAATYCNEVCQVAPRPRACGNGCTEAGEQCGEPGLPMCSGGQTCDSSCECVSVCAVIEDFESGTWPHAPWVLYSGSGAAVSGTYAHDGSFGIRYNADWYYRTDVTTAVGMVLSTWVRYGGGRYYMGFDASASGAKSFVIAFNTGDIRFQENPGYDFVERTTSPQAYMSGRWYRAELEIQAGGVAVGRLYDQDGTTLLNTVTHTFAGGIGAGGLAVRSFSGIDSDTIRLCPGPS